MSQARSFTIELTQVGTGKKATVKVNQAGFTPQYIFKWANGSDDTTKRINIASVPTESLQIIYFSEATALQGANRPISVIAKNNNDSMVEWLVPTVSTVSVKIKPNSTYSTRSVTITLTQEESGKTLTLIVTQAAKADDGVFKADPTALSFGAASDTKSSKITSTSKGQTVGWTVSNKSSMPSWLTISGEGTGTLSANVKDND